ncbi:hypothetical protein LR69_02733 [Geobacillus sp. BCO2]|nr:hypothetical protein LR69_02733 [Geobacillus sp. BCO2]
MTKKAGPLFYVFLALFCFLCDVSVFMGFAQFR